MPKHTAQEVYGFSSIVAAGRDEDRDFIRDILDGITAAAAERGIPITEPSDALDLSRDIILDEAVGVTGNWTIQDGTLFVAYDDVVLRALIKAELES